MLLSGEWKCEFFYFSTSEDGGDFEVSGECSVLFHGG